MTLVITATATDNATDNLNTKENAPMTDTATDTITPDTPDTETTPTIPTLTLDAVNSTPDTLATLSNKGIASTSKLLNAIKSVITGQTVVVAKDCTVSHVDGAYRIDLADHDCKKALSPVADINEELSVALPRPASDRLTVGKRYLQNIAIVSAMMRATRDLHSIRSFTVAIDSRKNEGNVDLVLTYTESVDTIALKVATLIAPCSHTRVALFNALLTASGLTPIDAPISLPRVKKLNMIKAPVATALA